ncbi:hypothetical protein QJQ45_019237, partial [Haematococcus lacustris]
SRSLASRQATTGSEGRVEDAAAQGAAPPPPCVSPPCVSSHCALACQIVNCDCLQVINIPGGAVLRGCKKMKCKLLAHYQHRAKVQLRVIASLFVLRIFLTCLGGCPTPGFTFYNQLQRRLVRKRQLRHPMPMPVFEDPSNQALLAKLQELQLGSPHQGQVEHRLLRPAWSQQRDLPVRGTMWCPVVAPRKPPQAPCSSQAATQPAATEDGPNTPPPAKRSKRIEAEQAAEPSLPTESKGKAQGRATKAKPAPQPGRWLDRDCNAALNMQHIGESRWRPLELCW